MRSDIVNMNWIVTGRADSAKTVKPETKAVLCHTCGCFGTHFKWCALRQVN